jgi:hypothetical protein
MSSKARITSEFPSQRDVASALRISAHRAAELKRQLFDLHITHPDGSITVIEAKHSRKLKTHSARKKPVAGGTKLSAKKK